MPLLRPAVEQRSLQRLAGPARHLPHPLPSLPAAAAPRALPAALASECAADQGKFWPFSDRLYANFNEWSRAAPEQLGPRFVAYAKAAGLNAATFEKCLSSGQHSAAVTRGVQRLDEALNVRGTPSVYVGGIRVANYSDPGEMQALRAIAAAGPAARQVVEDRLSSLR
ncbi:DsbA family protein [Deinococcus lacus]|uniref:DsbA family protein n=1 Tax=Deinococcus lacus TaxID=392561 RepID=A0ABW1YDH4_9DEIO